MQPESALTAIKIAIGVVPAGFILLAVGVMLWYPLTEKVFASIVAETAARRAQRASVVA